MGLISYNLSHLALKHLSYECEGRGMRKEELENVNARLSYASFPCFLPIPLASVVDGSMTGLHWAFSSLKLKTDVLLTGVALPWISLEPVVLQGPATAGLPCPLL